MQLSSQLLILNIGPVNGQGIYFPKYVLKSLVKSTIFPKRLAEAIVKTNKFPKSFVNFVKVISSSFVNSFI